MPEPILVSIAAAVAGKGASTLYDVVKEKFADRPQANAALEAAEGSAPESPEVNRLGRELALAEQEDPEFSAALRATWSSIGVQQRADHDGVINEISGSVEGRVVQARDIEGGVNF